jgi:hypothetical protein
MNSTLIVVFLSIAIFFLLFILLFLFRERVEVQLDKNILLLKFPFKKKRLDLENDLVNWKVQEAYYLRMGMVYSINMLFRSGRRVAVSSRLNHENYERLYEHLSSQYPGRQVYEE